MSTERALTFRLESVVKSRQEILEDFEGPLDLILELLRRHKIEIQDLRIALLLEQYLIWMEQRRELDMEVASEFIAMASYLVYLKTKMLLTVGQDDGDEEVDELLLALQERKRAEEYEKILIARAFLEDRAGIGRHLICKAPEPLKAVRTYTLTHDKSVLTAAVKEIGLRGLRKQPPPVTSFQKIVAPEKHPVAERVTGILSVLRNKGRLLFSRLLNRGNRSESIASFLAVLELCRMREIFVTDKQGDYQIELRGAEHEK